MISEDAQTLVVCMLWSMSSERCEAALPVEYNVICGALQALLAFVWVFNIAAVIVWMPWLYRWQYQPTKE